MGVGLFFHRTTDRTGGSSHKLFQGRLRLDTNKFFFSESTVIHWNTLPREVFKKCVEVAPKDMASEHSGDGLLI